MRLPVWCVSASERRAMAAAACTLPRASRSSASPGCGSSPSFDASAKYSSAESNLPQQPVEVAAHAGGPAGLPTRRGP